MIGCAQNYWPPRFLAMNAERVACRVAIRVDASTQIGTGHFMRCLTLADELCRRCATVHFVSRQLPEYLEAMLVERKLGFTRIGASGDPAATGGLAHAAWLGTSQEVDVAQSRGALSGGSWDWLIVDHYALDAAWEQAMRPLVGKIAVIDDIADRAHDCDVLIDQNLHEDAVARYCGLVPSHCRMLLGPGHAILRSEFREARRNMGARSGHVKHVLIFFGGMDRENYTGRVLEALCSLDLSGLVVDVVIGEQHPYLRQIQEACLNDGWCCHVQTDRMGLLMSTADLAIGAGGVAVWERCCVGLPSFVIPMAENQEEQVFNLANRGVIYAPALVNKSANEVSGHVRALLGNSCLLSALSKAAAALVDGNGVLRVVNGLIGTQIRMRRASQDDSPNIFTWRNTPEIRSVSRNQDLISWQDHQAWFTAALSSESRYLLIGELFGCYVGVVRFDVLDGEAEVSIYLTPEMLGQGWGGDLLKSAEAWFVHNVRDVRHLKAVVLGENEKSMRLFTRTGYSFEQAQFIKEIS